MSYTYEYARPGLTADCVIFARDAHGLNVLMIQRKHDPFKGQWAFPGGFIEEGEGIDATAARELEEETGLKDIPLKQLHVFGEPGRDPRGHVVSVVYYGVADLAEHNAQGGDDAAEARWFPIDDVPELAFDHDKILAMALERVRELLT